MLVLTRRLGERIVIAKDITVAVVGMYGKTVRLGIEAPHEVTVLRSELTLPNPAQPKTVAGHKL